MHWGQIKTLLILSFLVLDVYLFIQFVDKKDDMDYSILEYQESSIEDQLLADAIKIRALPEKEYEETFITVKQREFEKEDLEDLEDQTPFIYNRYFIISKLQDRLSVPSETVSETMDQFVQKFVHGGEQYTYWGKDERLNVLIYFQNKHNRPVYYNRNGLILLFLDEDGKVDYYTQTMLGKAEELSENKKLIEPMQAIEVLYNANELETNDEITSVNIGFHTRIPLESGVQVFAPVWRVNINEEKDYFINAIEGLTNRANDEEFLLETIDTAITRIDVNNDNKIIKTIISDLEGRIKNINQSEGE